MFNSYYCNTAKSARPISELVQIFSNKGSSNLDVACSEILEFSSDEWNAKSEKEQQEILMNYRIAYLGDTMVNWCAQLGTVLANDEVSEGLSIRGGYPVEQKKMRQWCLRVSAYAERLLEGLDIIDWTESLKETQRYWIGRSEGAVMHFNASNDISFDIFTTRADTIFGVTFMVLAPESELVDQLTNESQKNEVLSYIEKTKKKTERERIADRTVTGVFSGSYAIHPFTGESLPIWISDYVLAGYGTGAIMAVPAHDSRDYDFAKYFSLPIIPLIEGCDVSEESFDAKEGVMINSDFLNGMTVREAIPAAISAVEERGLGYRKVNYRLRDAIFSRQRYWGEPFPIYYKDGMPYTLDEIELPLELPEVDKYLPTETGEPPLGRAKDWKYQDQYDYELSTMPGWAGSSWYWYRYMDAHNSEEFVSKSAVEYWRDVDLYIGGSEHATGHLLYSRFWNKFLKDLGYVPEEEPFKKLINQGMIQGRSNFIYRVLDEEGKGTNRFVSYGLKDEYKTNAIHVDVNIVFNDILNIEKFKASRSEYKDAEFILENGKYHCGHEVEKMSKSKFNVVSPDDIIDAYGADTLRMYEMFLGPLEQSKPWNTNGIEGVFKFLRKFWKLFHDQDFNFKISDDKATPAELKALHKIIKKVQEDIDRFSFNTSVSAFMICVNELTDLKCNKREVLQDLCLVLAPYAPHITEDLWEKLGNEPGTISYASYPVFNPEYLVESEFAYPISVNGKVRLKIQLSLSMEAFEVEQEVLKNKDLQKYLEGKSPKKVIVVKGRIVNIVL